MPGSGATAVGGSAGARPNVVVVMTDDQSLESLRVMPNTRELIGRAGVVFRESFVNYSRCCPSRATFFTGQYAHNHGVLSNGPPNGGYERLRTSNWLPGWLKAAGYRTVHIGKFLNKYGERDPLEVPPGWSEWYATVDPTTYRYWGYTLNENGRLKSYGREGDPASYSTDLFARRAVDAIERLAPQPQPFFLSVAFLAPHTGGPLEPGDPVAGSTPAVAPRHRGIFADEPLLRTPSFDELDVSDKPGRVRRLPSLRPVEIALIRGRYRQRLESLLAVDEGVASIVDALRASGKLDNTLVIFTSDNGYFQGEHRIPDGKLQLYEPSIRVPLLMRGPGIPAGGVARELVTNADLAPTVLEAADVRPGLPQDGRSLLPLAGRPDLNWRRALLLEGGNGRGLNAFGIRTPRFMYAEYDSGERELYDLDEDPYQLSSRHRDPRYAGVLAMLVRRLDSLRRCRGASCH
jgi:arylsulfatase A-like enzyme